jgi:hypothetical protein
MYVVVHRFKILGALNILNICNVSLATTRACVVVFPSRAYLFIQKHLPLDVKFQVAATQRNIRFGRLQLRMLRKIHNT